MIFLGMAVSISDEEQEELEMSIHIQKADAGYFFAALRVSVIRNSSRETQILSVHMPLDEAEKLARQHGILLLDERLEK